MQMEYIGRPGISAIDTISARSVSPEDFFSKYISTRTPVKFSDHLTDEAWKVSKERWNHAYLKEQCPKGMKLKVEHRANSEGRYGQAQEQQMLFHDFLDAIDKGCDTLYLTTQNLDTDHDGRPDLMAAPLTSLRHDFPLVPALFRTLIPANVNLWYGLTKTLSSSGLHHDYHDNLYVMLRGQKVITLHSPAEAANMYLAGELVKVHTNGRMCYKGKLTRADGADLQADRAVEAALRLQAAAQRLGDEGGEEDEDAEDEIDRALEDILDAECCDEEEEEEDSEEDLEDDPFDAAYCDDSDDDSDDNEEEEDKAEGDASTGKRKSCEASDKPSKRAASTLPVSFSRVDTHLPAQVIREHYPLYADAAKRAVQVTVREGEMIYIPAGWFHEVQSLGSEGHMAFNYWFHPPDNHTEISGTDRKSIPYSKPYVSDFWAKDLKERGSV